MYNNIYKIGYNIISKRSTNIFSILSLTEYISLYYFAIVSTHSSVL